MAKETYMRNNTHVVCRKVSDIFPSRSRK